jgi:hypothetical protein
MEKYAKNGDGMIVWNIICGGAMMILVVPALTNTASRGNRSQQPGAKEVRKKQSGTG